LETDFVHWVWTFLLNGTLAAGGYIAARNLFGISAGVIRSIAAAILGWAWITLGMTVLGWAGVLSRGPLLAWTIVGLGTALAARAAGLGRLAFEPPKPAIERWDLCAVVSVGVALAAAMVLGERSLFGAVKVVSDGPIYHLYFGARWWKEARIFLVAAPFGENAATYFPATGDLWFAWLMICWGGERLAKIGQAPFLLLSASSLYEIMRRLGANKNASAIAVCWFVGCTPFLLFSFEPNVDTIFVAGYIAAVLFYLRYVLDGGRVSSLILAGLAAGCAWGTKPTGIVFVPVLLAVGTLAILVQRRHDRRVLGSAIALIAPAMLMVAFWYGRNAVLSGNPLYPLQIRVFGKVLFTGWYSTDVMRLSQYAISITDWRALVDILLVILDPRQAPFWLLALLGAWQWGRPATMSDRWVWGCAALAVVNVALYWLLIPYRTQQRFMIHALALGAIPLARFFDRSSIARVAATSLLLLHVATPETWPWGPDDRSVPWDLSLAIPNSVGAILDCTRRFPGWANYLTGIVILTGLCVGVAALWLRQATQPSIARFTLALGATGATIAGLTWSQSADQSAPKSHPFFPRSFPDYYVGWIQLDQLAGTRGARIAYAGTDLPYYLLGSGLRNEVRYINIDDHPDWLLHDYHRAASRAGKPSWPNPRPGWDREHPNYDAWLSNLRSAGIQLLVVCRANPEEGLHNIADAERFPIERVWADSHPEIFRPVYGVAEGDPQFRIYRLRSPDG
jgi:hypothetical protein